MHRIEKYLILGLIGLTLIISIGSSFAYFTFKTSVTGNGSSISSSAAQLPKIVFDAGSAVTSTVPLTPGDKIIKTFNVTFTPTNEIKTVKYNVNFGINTNTFSKCTSATKTIEGYPNECTENANELVYRLKRKVGSNGSETLIVTDQDITGYMGTKTYTETINSNTQVTYYYTLEVEFVNTNANQLHNMNKQFNGVIDITFA